MRDKDSETNTDRERERSEGDAKYLTQQALLAHNSCDNKIKKGISRGAKTAQGVEIKRVEVDLTASDYVEGGQMRRSVEDRAEQGPQEKGGEKGGEKDEGKKICLQNECEKSNDVSPSEAELAMKEKKNECYDDESPSDAEIEERISECYHGDESISNAEIATKEEISKVFCKDKDCTIRIDNKKDKTIMKDNTALLDHQIDVCDSKCEGFQEVKCEGTQEAKCEGHYQISACKQKIEFHSQR